MQIDRILENLDVFGDDENYSASIKDGPEVSFHAELQSCKFCEGDQQLIKNTHTDCYWIECACGIEMHSNHRAEDGLDYMDLDCGNQLKTRHLCIEAHEKALIHIINKWNGIESQ